MNQQVFNLAPPNGALPSVGLGFVAKAVIVDNYTSSYVNIPEAGAVLPPWIYGAVIALPLGVSQAKASLSATTPAPTGPVVPIQQATLTWTDAPVPANSGHLLTQPSYQVPTVIGTFNSPANTLTTKTFDVPSGTVTLGIQDIGGGGNTIAPKMTLTGHQSGSTVKTIYFPQQSTGIYTALWNPAEDTSVDAVIDNTTSGTASSFYVIIAYPFVPGVVGPSVENATPPFAGTSTAPSIGTLVTSNGTDAAPWQAAKKNAAVTVASVGSGATQTIISASAGVTVYLHAYSFSQDNANAAANWQLQDSSGTLISSWFDTNVRKVFASGDFRGFPITTGKGVQILNGGANASFIGGFLSYSTA